MTLVHRARGLRLGPLVTVLLLSSLSFAPSVEAARKKIDGVYVRFSAPELGGTRRPAFVFQNEIRFEALLVAEKDPAFDRTAGILNQTYVDFALEQHIAERLLSSLPILPKPTESEIEAQVRAAIEQAYAEVGADRFAAIAAKAEVSETVTARFFRRKALASLYLDRMVTPMLSPSRGLLFSLHQAGKTPYPEAPFEAVEPALRRWYVRRELAQSIASFYQSARPRLLIEVVSSPLDGN